MISTYANWPPYLHTHITVSCIRVRENWHNTHMGVIDWMAGCPSRGKSIMMYTQTTSVFQIAQEPEKNSRRPGSTAEQIFAAMCALHTMTHVQHDKPIRSHPHAICASIQQAHSIRRGDMLGLRMDAHAKMRFMTATTAAAVSPVCRSSVVAPARECPHVFASC